MNASYFLWHTLSINHLWTHGNCIPIPCHSMVARLLYINTYIYIYIHTPSPRTYLYTCIFVHTYLYGWKCEKGALPQRPALYLIILIYDLYLTWSYMEFPMQFRSLGLEVHEQNALKAYWLTIAWGRNALQPQWRVSAFGIFSLNSNQTCSITRPCWALLLFNKNDFVKTRSTKPKKLNAVCVLLWFVSDPPRDQKVPATKFNNAQHVAELTRKWHSSLNRARNTSLIAWRASSEQHLTKENRASHWMILHSNCTGCQPWVWAQYHGWYWKGLS